MWSIWYESHRNHLKQLNFRNELSQTERNFSLRNTLDGNVTSKETISWKDQVNSINEEKYWIQNRMRCVTLVNIKLFLINWTAWKFTRINSSFCYATIHMCCKRLISLRIATQMFWIFKWRSLHEHFNTVENLTNFSHTACLLKLISEQQNDLASSGFWQTHIKHTLMVLRMPFFLFFPFTFFSLILPCDLFDVERSNAIYWKLIYINTHIHTFALSVYNLLLSMILNAFFVTY